MSTAATSTPDPTQYRLPTNLKATHYDIIVKTDLENLTFNGIAKVRYASVLILDPWVHLIYLAFMSMLKHPPLLLIPQISNSEKRTSP